jgi:hypothetical protein
MSAAATAAGYLYASGRLRGRTPAAADPAPPRPRPAPKIQYRSRRWKPLLASQGR